MDDRLPQRLEQRLRPFEIGLAATSHDRERRVDRPRLATRHRRVNCSGSLLA